MKLDRDTLFHYIGISTLICQTNFLNKNSTAIDIGIGKNLHNTIEYTKLFKTVYAVDAHKDSYEKMLKEIQKHKLKNLKPYHYFLSNTQETVQFHCNGENIGYSTRHFDSIKAAGKHLLPNWSTIEIQSTTLDDIFLDKIEDLAFIKIDAENSDVAIITGADKLIQKWRPVIQFEHWNDDANFTRYFCKKFKYRFFPDRRISSYILLPKGNI